MNKAFLTVLACAGGLVAGGCDNESLGGLVSDLAGEYEIPESGCWIKVEGSKITAVDDDGQAPCVHGEDDGDESFTRTLTVAGTITEDRITGTLTYVDEFDYHNDGCTIVGKYDYSLALDVSRKRGRRSPGRFGALAGDWEGTLRVIDDHYEDQSGNPWCDDLELRGDSLYEIEADVEGDSAEIDYELEDGEEDEGEIEIEVEDDDELSVAGWEIEIR